ncbi:hypothetical protein RHECNPAF_14110029 [Rhizobium etli CNPAF512]|nr:hypothetical protein RHECNPAF_14110029 [Rhizobium etli CNPAF512]
MQASARARSQTSVYPGLGRDCQNRRGQRSSNPASRFERCRRRFWPALEKVLLSHHSWHSVGSAFHCQEKNLEHNALISLRRIALWK